MTRKGRTGGSGTLGKKRGSKTYKTIPMKYSEGNISSPSKDEDEAIAKGLAIGRVLPIPVVGQVARKNKKKENKK